MTFTAVMAAEFFVAAAREPRQFPPPLTHDPLFQTGGSRPNVFAANPALPPFLPRGRPC